MSDLLKTIAPKSDQLNADDLIGGRSLTITITGVAILAGEQPVALSYEGDGGKPWKPCKSMRRVLVSAWGSDGTKYIGRRATLYRDDKVRFGNAEVGGIRISHLSDIDGPLTIALTASRAVRKPFIVQPLALASAEEVRILTDLLAVVKPPKSTTDAWLKKAKAESWAEMPSDAIGKCIDHLKGLAAKIAH